MSDVYAFDSEEAFERVRQATLAWEAHGGYRRTRDRRWPLITSAVSTPSPSVLIRWGKIAEPALGPWLTGTADIWEGLPGVIEGDSAETVTEEQVAAHAPGVPLGVGHRVLLLRVNGMPDGVYLAIPLECEPEADTGTGTA